MLHENCEFYCFSLKFTYQQPGVMSIYACINLIYYLILLVVVTDETILKKLVTDEMISE